MDYKVVIYDSNWIKTGKYTSSDIGYGLQSSDVRGFVDGASTFNGTVAFSTTNYWHDVVTNAPKSDYPGAYSAPNQPTVYDPVNYKGAPGDNDYSVAYYVEEYKDKLETYGLTVQSARLLTYSEATDSSIGCSKTSWSCPTTGFITNTSFWLGSAGDGSYAWYVLSVGEFSYGGLIGNFFGVRPVIVISKDAIQSNNLCLYRTCFFKFFLFWIWRLYIVNFLN